MEVLLTGSDGFVGRHMRNALEDRGHTVAPLDLKTGFDARDFFRASDKQFDMIVHLAAVVGGRETIDREPLKVAVDLSIDAEMFQYALRTRPQRVVYYSSSAAYPVMLQTNTGHYRECPLVELDIDLQDISSPDMSYGFAKLAGEYQAQFLEAEGIRTHVFRPFSGYGEDQALDYPFPSFIARAKAKADPFEIWGDGEAYRDFIHIEDVVNATLVAVEQDIQGPVNLGSGIATSFNELANKVTAASGYSPKLKHLIDKPVGVQYRVADNSKMLSFYTPRISLDEGIQRALNI